MSSALFETAWCSESYRDHNEDRVLLFEHESLLIVAVADGVGGRANGAQAAESAVRQVEVTVRSVDKPKNLLQRHFWTQLLSEIDEALSDDEGAGETTLVALALSQGKVVGASAGDSGAWLLSRGRQRVLTAGQRAKPFVGSAAAFPVAFEATVRDEVLLLATDGLLKYSGEEAIANVVHRHPLREAAPALVEMVRLRSGSLWDDTTVALCRIVK
jgi:serine/threonine protein phosphatase PrpC